MDRTPNIPAGAGPTISDSPGRVRLAYVLPMLHFAACLSLPLGYLASPRLQYVFLITWEVVMWVDFPVSLVAIFFAWRHQLFAATWIFVAGTLWWYFLGQRIDRKRQRLGS
jgi:hypothetical protein